MSSAQDFVDFLNAASGSPFVAAATLRTMLLSAGFAEIDEHKPWTLAPGRSFFFVRNGAAVVAFSVGAKVSVGRCGFAIAGAHTDSPALRLKPPTSAAEGAGGAQIVACETYGGGIWQTWFDRDLGVAGKALVVDAGGRVEARTVAVRRPLLRIPTVAPHLEAMYGADGFKVNKEEHLRALLSLAAPPATAADGVAAGPLMATQSGRPRVHAALVALVAKELGVKPEQIVATDLRLCDAQPAALGGFEGEFVLGQGIDNLNGCFTCARALIDACGDIAEEPNVRLLTLFDHEECGSLSAQGAESPLVRDTMLRILRGLVAGGAPVCPELKDGPGMLEEALLIAVRKSLVLSVDNAHAVHPNYSGKHESQQPPRINQGPVIKHNVNTRYATDAEGMLAVRMLAREASVPLQDFVIRQDSGCGSTIGPTTSGQTGIRTVDIGNAQLAMHSIREMCGAHDIPHMVNLVCAFFKGLSKLQIPL